MSRLLDRLRGLVVTRVLIEAGPGPAEHVAATQEVFARWGFRVEPRPEYPLTGGPATEILWAVYVVAAVPLASFFHALASEAGKDAYAAMKDWVKDVTEARRAAGGSGVILIFDSADVQLRIPSPISDEALDRLHDVDLQQAAGGFISWDEERNEWIVALPGLSDD